MLIYATHLVKVCELWIRPKLKWTVSYNRGNDIDKEKKYIATDSFLTWSNIIGEIMWIYLRKCLIDNLVCKLQTQWCKLKKEASLQTSLSSQFIHKCSEKMSSVQKGPCVGMHGAQNLQANP